MTFTSDYAIIDAALKARWLPFCDLATEVTEFVPKTMADFGEYRLQELARLQELNPAMSKESLLEIIDGQITVAAEPKIQILEKFYNRTMAEYVTVAFLAHALVEAAINFILAVGLAQAGAEDLFGLLEKADIKEKWLFGPKAFDSTYHLPKSGALYSTLHQITRQRNAFVHYKVKLEIGGEVKLEGSRVDRASLNNSITWVRRFFSLPYDLVAHARSQLPAISLFLSTFDSAPIDRFPVTLEP